MRINVMAMDIDELRLYVQLLRPYPDAVKRLEAKLDKAVAALREIAALPHHCGCVSTAINRAQRALEETGDES